MVALYSERDDVFISEFPASLSLNKNNETQLMRITAELKYSCNGN